MQALWPPGEGLFVQDGGDSMEAAEGAAQNPGPLLTGPDAALWVGFGAFVVIFLLVLMLVIRGRVVAPARRKAIAAQANFFEPAGEDAEISFEEPEREDSLPPERSGDSRNEKQKDKRRQSSPKKAGGPRSGREDLGDLGDPRAAPAVEGERQAAAPARQAKKSGSPFAGLFQKKKPDARAHEEPALEDDVGEVAIASAQEGHREKVFADDAFDDRRAGEEEAHRRREEDERRAEEERALRARMENEERERIYREAREEAAREAEFERRKAEAALEQRMQSLSAMQRRLDAERAEARDESAARDRLSDSLEARFAALADRLSAKLDGASAGETGRAGSEAPDAAHRIAGEVAALRKATEEAIDRLARRLDAMETSSPAGAAGLAREIASLNALIAGRTASSTAGRIQLSDLVRSVLPAGRYAFAQKLSSGRTADCLIDAAGGAPPIAVDARFPVEAYDQYARDRINPDHEARARGDYRRAVLRHVVDIAENLIVPGETADFAVMFAPSEAIFNDLHTEFGDVVQDSYRAKVWILSPTSLMASLHMMSALAAGAPERSERQTALAAEIEALKARVDALESGDGRDSGAGESPPVAAADADWFAPEGNGEGRDPDTGDLFRAPEDEVSEEAEPRPAARPAFPLRAPEGE